MNDSNQIVDSLSGEDSGRKMKKLPILLIVLALILGFIMWRARHAAVPPVPAAQDTTAAQAAQAAKAPETAKVEVPAPVAASPETTVAAPAPAAAPVETTVVEKPHPVKRKHAHVKPVEENKVAEEKAAAPDKTMSEKSSEEPAPVAILKPATPKSKVKPEPKTVAKIPTPVPSPAPAAPVAATSSDKKFAMEDQPMPEKPVLSEESKLAFNAPPKAAESQSDLAAATPAASDAFKQAMDAYHKHDYENAIKLFGQLPKPTTKQQGDPTRDQYVQGNFLLGISLLKSDRAADAVSAFTTVLQYDRYNPVASMNLGICYVELKQYFKANKAFESVTRDQGSIDPADFDDVMQRTKYFWALAWTRMYKTSKDADKQAYYQQQAVMRWKDYQTWFGKNEKYRSENRKAEDYVKSLSAM